MLGLIGSDAEARCCAASPAAQEGRALGLDAVKAALEELEASGPGERGSQADLLELRVALVAVVRGTAPLGRLVGEERLARCEALAMRLLELRPQTLSPRDFLLHAVALAGAFESIGRPSTVARIHAGEIVRYPALSSHAGYHERSLISARLKEGAIDEVLALADVDEARTSAAVGLIVLARRNPGVARWLAPFLAEWGLSEPPSVPLPNRIAEPLMGLAMGVHYRAWALVELGLPGSAYEEGQLARRYLDLAHRARRYRSPDQGIFRGAHERVTELGHEIALRSGRWTQCAEACADLLENPHAGAAAGFLAGARLRLGTALLQLRRYEEAHAALSQAAQDPQASSEVRWVAWLWLGELGLDRDGLISPEDVLRELDAIRATGAERATSPLGATRIETLRSAWCEASGSVAGELAANDALEAAVDELIQQWNDLPAREGGLGVLRTRNARFGIGRMIAVERRDRGDDEAARLALQLVARVEASGSLARRMQAPPYDHEAVTAALERVEGGLLVYLPGPRDSFVIAVDAQGGVVADIPTSEDLLEPLREFTGALRREAASPPGFVSQVDAGELTRLSAELLPERIRARLGKWRCVGVVGTDLLSSIAIEALTLDGKPLGESHAVAHVPSLPVATALVRRAQADPLEPRGRMVLASGIRHGAWARTHRPDLQELGLGEADLRSILRSVAPDATDLRLGQRASSVALAAAMDGNVAELMVLSHGVGVPDKERSAAVLLDAEPDGSALEPLPLLDARWIESSSSPPLVVMAACGAGFAPRRPGDAGAASLAGAWLVAGASSVVEPSADLLLGQTLAQLTFFQAAIGAGDSPAEALRVSRVRLREELGVESTGALLRVVGWPFESQPTAGLRHMPTRASRAGWFPWLLILAIMLGLGALARARRRASCSASDGKTG